MEQTKETMKPRQKRSNIAKNVIFRWGVYIASVGILNSVEAVSCSSQIPEYVSICKRAAEDGATFLTFKSHAGYRYVLEHVDKQTGWQYLRCICLDSPEWIPLFDRFRTNDLVGAPQVEDFGVYGTFSPTTLRYIKVASDLKKKWGSLAGWRILEIGGGYGGQCKILADLFPFANYTIVDLPECNALTKRYLDIFGITNVFFVDPSHLHELVSQYDLVISNYAFSELDAAQQEEYLNKILVKSKRGYMTCNRINHFFGLDTLSVESWAHSLTKQQHKVRIEEEAPKTSADGLLITWNE